MNPERIIGIEDGHLVKTYQKLGIVLHKGKGVRVWDVKGKEYIDFMGGYGVAIVGHSHPKVVRAIKEQAEMLTICHGSLYNDVRASFLEELFNMVPNSLDVAFLSNSGTEAVEAALKMAMKYTGKKNFIAAKGSYHGKTMGALSVTYSEKYRSSFEPFPYKTRFVKYGSVEELEKIDFKDVAAIILEPVQGEGGINIPPPDYFPMVRELADKWGVPLIMDEVQAGLGRTGKLWAHQHWNVEPDIMTIGKGIAGGVPMGVTVAKKEIGSSLKVGEHTSTFGGNPLSAAAAKATLRIIKEEHLPERAGVMGEKLTQLLKELKETTKLIREIRGLGLMIGIELRIRFQNILLRCAERGLLMLYSGRNVIRLLPPLILTDKDVEEALPILKNSIEEEEKKMLFEQ
jgi:acetylornithine/LysW-gamma-L-lysine aminotransferase